MRTRCRSIPMRHWGAVLRLRLRCPLRAALIQNLAAPHSTTTFQSFSSTLLPTLAPMVALVLSSCQAAVRASSTLGSRRQQARRLSAMVPKASTEEQASTPAPAVVEAEVRGLSALPAACAAPNCAPLHAFHLHASFGQPVWLRIDWCGWGVRNCHPPVGHLPLLAACTTNTHSFHACLPCTGDLQPQMPAAQPQMPVTPPQPTVAASAAKAPAQPSLMGLMSFSGPAPGECTRCLDCHVHRQTV